MRFEEAVICMAAIGFLAALGFELAGKLARYRLKQIQRKMLQERLNELQNGRKTGHLTVDKELLS